jgi:hypothetical protein
MSTRFPTLLAVLLALAGTACTATDRPPVRTDYTRPDCPQDYLTGPKFMPCYTQR